MTLRARASRFGLAPVLVCTGVTAIIITVFLRLVDLQPRVDETFFFSHQDPQVRVDNEILRAFPQAPQIIVAAAGDIRSTGYADRIRALSDALAAVPGVSGVESLSRGPHDIDDALKSPLWSRLLIAHDRQASYVFVSLGRGPAGPVVREVERLQRRFTRPGFTLMISGVPYVTELIGRNLAEDLRVFSLAAVAVFGLVLLVVFRSPWVLLGTFAAAIDSSAPTLIATHLLHIPIGPLTANLSTMVFVMTLSPIVFLTYNARRVGDESASQGRAAVRAAIGQTVASSFWSCVCMFLGFVSLLFVPSTPMRHLGIAGAIGALLAFASAYAVYPWFLEHASIGRRAATPPIITRLRGFFAERHGRIAAGLALFSVVGAVGLMRLNTDPDLPSYFKERSDIRSGLDFVDQNGGSSPLKLVVEDQQHALLNNGKAYHRLWSLQQALERDPAVGSVLSMAPVLGEAKRPWIANFLSTSHLISILGTPKYGEVSRELINADRTRTLFLLRMRETQRTGPRDATITRVKGIIEHAGFHTVQVGGTFPLLSQMAKLLSTSIVSGVLLLIGIFVVLGFALSRSWRVAAAMLVSLAIIPVVVRGYIAYLGMPLDFITASAANIDLGIGVDAMIYITLAARRSGAGRIDDWRAWSQACSQLWQPIGTSLLVICSGFGIFLLSNFPPTQRFGLFVMFGSAAAATTALFLFPWLASLSHRVVAHRTTTRSHTPATAPS